MCWGRRVTTASARCSQTLQISRVTPGHVLPRTQWLQEKQERRHGWRPHGIPICCQCSLLGTQLGVWFGHVFWWQDIFEELSQDTISCLFLRVLTQPLAWGLQTGRAKDKSLLALPALYPQWVFFFSPVHGLIFTVLRQSRTSSLCH
jgi:hypothetical protein